MSIIDDENLHQKLGFMPLIAPIIADQEKKWFEEKLKQAEIISSLEGELTTHKQHRIFIEGKSDKGVFSKVVEVYAPNLSEQVYFDLKGNNCANSATDKAKAFHLVQKHNKEQHKLKGALILDNDPAGIECKQLIDDFLKDSKTQKNINVSLLTKPPQVYNLVKKGFNVVADLETCLPEHIWKLALSKGWLEEKESLAKKFTKNKVTELFESKKDPDELIGEQSEYHQLLINYSFTDKGKEGLSKHIAKLPVDEILENKTLDHFKPLFEKIESFMLE